MVSIIQCETTWDSAPGGGARYSQNAQWASRRRLVIQIRLGRENVRITRSFPASVSKNGAPVMSFGVMGGTLQHPQGHVQVLVAFTDYGQNPQTACDTRCSGD